MDIAIGLMILSIRGLFEETSGAGEVDRDFDVVIGGGMKAAFAGDEA